MKKLISLFVLLLLLGGTGLEAQRVFTKFDTVTVDSATVVGYGHSGLPTSPFIVGWYIWNTDAVDTVYVNFDGNDPTAANSFWLETNNSMNYVYPTQSIQLLTRVKSGQASKAFMIIGRTYERR